MTDLQILEGAEDFSLAGGDTGALLIHGYTGSPQGMRGLGTYLNERGLAVEGIRLPGHGTSWEDLALRTSPDWVEAVDAGFEKVAAGRERVFIVGLSFGGALSLDFAARHPERVAGVVLIAPFVMTKDPRRFLAGTIRRVTKSIPGVGNDIADPGGREIVYERVPTASTYSMLQFCKSVRARLKDVTAPLLVLHSKNDHTAHPVNATVIHDGVSSSDKEIVWFERSYHVLTLDYDRDEVFNRTGQFIEKRS